MFLTASWCAQPHWACCPSLGPRSWAGWRSWCRGEAHCCPRHSSWWSLLRVTRPPHRTPAGTWGSGRWPGAWTSQSWTWGRHHVTLLMNKTHKWKIISENCLRLLKCFWQVVTDVLPDWPDGDWGHSAAGSGGVGGPGGVPELGHTHWGHGHWSRESIVCWQGQRRGKGYRGLTEAVRVLGTAAGRAQAERVMSVSLGSLLGVTRPTPQGRTQEKLQILKTIPYIRAIKKLQNLLLIRMTWPLPPYFPRLVTPLVPAGPGQQPGRGPCRGTDPGPRGQQPMAPPPPPPTAQLIWEATYPQMFYNYKNHSRHQAPVGPGKSATHRMRPPPSLVASPAFLQKPANIAHWGQGL